MELPCVCYNFKEPAFFLILEIPAPIWIFLQTLTPVLWMNPRITLTSSMSKQHHHQTAACLPVSSQLSLPIPRYLLAERGWSSIATASRVHLVSLNFFMTFTNLISSSAVNKRLTTKCQPIQSSRPPIPCSERTEIVMGELCSRRLSPKSRWEKKW